VANDLRESVTDSVRILLAAQIPAHVTDRDLLLRFITQRDQTAFAALVHRHSPMVLGVCRRVLHNAHDAEDACQATFLILVHKAAGIRNQDSLAAWLHRVAHRLAVDLRAQRARRACQPLPAEETPAPPDNSTEPLWREVHAALDEELQHLPDHYRVPLLLCYLAGKTRDEAAQQLGWSLDVLRGRLERGREALRRRLVRRGLTLSAALLAEGLTQTSAFGRVPATLILKTIQYAQQIAGAYGTAAGLSGTVSDLVKRGLQLMIAGKKKLVAILLLAACFAGVAAYAVFREWPASPEQAWAVSLSPEQLVSAETVELAGKVLGSDGRPASGAKVHLISLEDSSLADGSPLAVTKEDGTFAFRVPEAELARHFVIGRSIDLVATAEGSGLAWRSVFDFLSETERGRGKLLGGLTKRRGGATLRLVKDDAPLTGRVEDAAGKPMPGVKVRLELVWANPKNDLTAWLAAVGRDQRFEATHKLLSLTLQGKGLGRLSATTTDARGNFRFAGIGSGRLACLQLSGPNMATATVLARTQAGPRVEVANLGSFLYPQPHGCYGADFALAASPARPIVGVVRDQDTGKPVAGAVVQSHQFAGTSCQGLPILSTQTDAAGRFRIDGMPAGRGNMLLVRAPQDVPYLPAVGEVDTSEGEGTATLDLKVRRGLWAEGQVIDADSGRPLAAGIDYYCLYSNPEGSKAPGFGFGMASGLLCQTDGAGRFRVPVLPGRGVLAVGLQGQRQHFLGSSWVTQAGKNYLDGGITLDAPDDVAVKGLVYKTHPLLLSISNYQHLELIDPKEGTTSIRCDVKLGSKAASKPEDKP
jgi:RNA polymerase sigma factor (sigma-70 family)